LNFIEWVYIIHLFAFDAQKRPYRETAACRWDRRMYNFPQLQQRIEEAFIRQVISRERKRCQLYQGSGRGDYGLVIFDTRGTGVLHRDVLSEKESGKQGKP
jgi:hypothetical protein